MNPMAPLTLRRSGKLAKLRTGDSQTTATISGLKAIHVLTIGDKDTQQADLAKCKQIESAIHSGR